VQSSRALALTMLRRWRVGREFADAIVAETFAQTDLAAADRAFALELFYGVLRNLSLLDFCIGELRAQPVDNFARDILRLGLYQTQIIETAAHAAVFETVELAPPRLRSLVNAILRRALREKDRLTTSVSEQPAAVRFSEPQFLVEKWTRQFGDETALELCRWNNQPAPVYARINDLKISPADFRRKYPNAESISANLLFVRLRGTETSLTNEDFYIHDPSTALACALLDPQPDEIVFDACAAPGGKSGMIAAQMENRGRLVAADRESRLDRVRGNLVRLGVENATIVGVDWLDLESIQRAKFVEKSFDKILLDAPCSNTGVMRRRVDARWRLAPRDFLAMPRQQLAILKKIAPFLRPGGSLVYSTCSLEPEENETVVAEFLSEEKDFCLTNTKTSLPWRDGFDGAFAARLHRPVAMG
jgi:16S rRNA (cytosine967-C5)-methyltransferase